MVSKEKFLDRFEHTFKLIFSHYIILYKIVWVYVFLYVLTLIISKILASFMIFLPISIFFFNPINIAIVWLFLLMFLLELFIYIWVYLWLIKTAKDLYNGVDVNFEDNIFYWFKNILNSFVIYFQIFLYVHLFPLILFSTWIWFIIIEITNWSQWWFEWFFNWLKYSDLIHGQFFIYWIWMIILALLTSIYFLIYRWFKSSFAIFQAIDKDDYSIESFKVSIDLSDNKWWRVFGNIVAFNIIVWLASSVFNWIFSIFSSIGNNSGVDFYKLNMSDPNNIEKIINSILWINLWYVLQIGVSAIITFAWAIFIYLFLKTLQRESWDIWVNSISTNEIKIEENKTLTFDVNSL